MKRVFEVVDEKSSDNLFTFLWRICWKGKHFRATIEDLPESKPEAPIMDAINEAQNQPPINPGNVSGTGTGLPELKNCGNCLHNGMDCSKRNFVCAGWQPKAAEPQSWEQRFHGEFSADFYAMATKHMDDVKSFIRADIERVHAGYAPLISAIEMAFKEADFLPDGRLTHRTRAVFEPIRKAEQDRRGEGGE